MNQVKLAKSPGNACKQTQEKQSKTRKLILLDCRDYVFARIFCMYDCEFFFFFVIDNFRKKHAIYSFVLPTYGSFPLSTFHF